MEFKVCAHEMRSYEISVEAETLKEAMEKIQDNPGLYIDDKDQGEYVDGSFEVSIDATECVNEIDFIKDMLKHDWLAEMSEDELAILDEIKDRHYLKQFSAGIKSTEKIYNDLALHGYSDEEIKRWNEQREFYRKSYNIPA